jgi:hypothetical protein
MVLDPGARDCDLRFAVRFATGAFDDQPTPIFGVKRGAVAFPGWPVASPASPRRSRPGAEGQVYCMNQPWLTTMDCPVITLLLAAAKNRTASATSSVVVN